VAGYDSNCLFIWPAIFNIAKHQRHRPLNRQVGFFLQLGLVSAAQSGLVSVSISLLAHDAVNRPGGSA
jgi:hypothetical protein